MVYPLGHPLLDSGARFRLGQQPGRLGALAVSSLERVVEASIYLSAHLSALAYLTTSSKNVQFPCTTLPQEVAMTTQTTYTHARAHLAELLNRVTANQELIIIQRRGAEDVALIAASELES